MKKTFKRTIACLLAVLMVISSLPFTALTANAGDSSTVSKQIGVKSYGLFTNETGNRWGGTYANVINDATEGMFDIGYVNFDISGFTATEFDQISPVYYNFFAKRTSGKKVPLHVMYPTKNQAYFAGNSNVVWNTTGNAKKIDASFYKDIWSNPINSNGRANSAKQIFGLQNLQTITLANQGDTRECSVNIVEAVKAAKAAHLSYVTIVFMLANGEASGDFTDGSGSSYSDTFVYYFGQKGNPDTYKLDVNVTTSSDADKQYIASMIDKGAPTYSYLTNEFGNALTNQTNYMKNVIYAGNWNTICSTYSDQHTDDKNNNFRFNSYGMNSVVAIYDSENADIRIPVTVGTSDNKVKSTTVYQYFGYDHVALNNGGAFSLAPEWTLCSSTTSFDDSTAINHKSFSSDINTNITNRALKDTENTRYHLKNDRQFKNYLKFAPNDTFNNNYYVTMNKLDYDVQADITYCWGVVSFTYKNTDDYKIPSSGNVSYSVINYLPLKNLLNSEELKSNYRNIKANESKYVASSLDNYYKALAALYKFNLTDGLTQDTVAAKASEMKTLIENYEKYKNPEIQKYTFTFEKVDGTKVTVDAQDSATARFWAVNGSKAPNTPATEKTNKDLINHAWTTYSWPYEPDENRVFKEIATENTEKHNLDKEHICTVCNSFIADESAYNDAVSKAETIIKNEQYTAESRKQYSAVVEKAKADKAEAKKQSDIDNLVAQILSAETLLRKTSCLIKFNSLSENETESTPIKTETVDYGKQYELEYKPTNGESVKGWVITTDGGKTVTTLRTLDTKFTLYVTKEAEVTVYTVPNPSTDTAQYSKVVFLGKNGNVVAIRYVEKDKELKTDEVKPSTIPFYTFTKWNYETVTGTGKDIYVRAEYTISDEAKCRVHFDGFTDGVKEYNYNNFVKLENADASKNYALASDEAGNNIITYLDGTCFYAPKTSDIYVVEVQEKLAKIGITGSFREILTEEQKAVAEFNCKFYLPEGCTLIEWGAQISANGRTQKVKSDTLSKYNEYSIRMKVPTSLGIKAFTGVAYVTYMQDGQEYTKYSDPVVQSLE